MTSPPPVPPYVAPGTPDPYRRGPRWAGSFVPLALITLGVFFLLSNLLPERSHAGVILIGLGTAFLIGRVTTGRMGYAVPAGLLMALGVYVSVPALTNGQPTWGGGWFFVLLGLGFALAYVIGLRPSAIWPLFPATILIGLGLMLFGFTAIAPLASLSWIVSFWPIALVVLGLWLMFRDHLPEALRRPIGTVGGLALLAYGVVAAASSVAAGGALARTGLAPSFGTSPFADTITLDAPISAGQTLSITNSNGSTSVRAAANASTVHLVATRHFSMAGQGPDVRLTPSSEGVSLQIEQHGGLFSGPSWVDYAIEVPAGARVRAQSSSGAIDIDGLSGDVQATSSSGGISMSNLSAAATAQASSGSIQLTNVAGPVSVSTNSGAIHGLQLQHLTKAESTSGNVQLDGVFAEAASVKTSSGSVQLTFEPNSAVRLSVQTGSGSITTGNVPLADVSQQRTSLTGTLGAPQPNAVLQIQTSSGSVRLNQ